jgi:hypothetical protein
MNTPDNLDQFEAFFRQELENQEPAVPDFHWRKIESAIRDEEDDQVAIIWLWRLLGLELAACLLLVCLAPKTHPIHLEKQHFQTKPQVAIGTEMDQNKPVSKRNAAPRLASEVDKLSYKLQESASPHNTFENTSTSAGLINTPTNQDALKSAPLEILTPDLSNMHEPKPEQPTTSFTFALLPPPPTSLLPMPPKDKNQHFALPVMENGSNRAWSWALEGGVLMSGFRFAPNITDEIILDRFTKTAPFAAQRLGWSVETKLLKTLKPRLRGKLSLGYQTLQKYIAYDAQKLSPDSLVLTKIDQNTYQVRVFNESETKVEDQHYDVLRLGLGLEYQLKACFTNLDLGLATTLQNPGLNGFVGLGIGLEQAWTRKSLIRLSGQFNLYLPNKNSFSSAVLQAKPWTLGLNAGIRWK